MLFLLNQKKLQSRQYCVHELSLTLFPTIFVFFKCSDRSAMSFQYIKLSLLNHLKLSTERLFLSQIRYKQKALISKVTDKKNATSPLLSLTQQG